MGTNPTSFRLPFTLPDDVHPAVVSALRYAFNGLADVNQAIAALNPKVNSNTNSISALSAIVTGINADSGTTPPVGVGPGTVNQQFGTAYTLRNSDFGALVVLNNAAPIAVTLDPALVTVPFYCVIENVGAGQATCTPASGTVNNVASEIIAPSSSSLVFFDGINFWMTTVPPQTFAAVTNEWIYSYDATTGLFAAKQPCAKNLCDSTTGAGHVVLDSGPTITNLTATGVTSLPGLQVFANNGAAISGGLVAGNLYRTGSNPDNVCVVH
jgi:hypothetical protein